eukprot:g19709.t2
MFQRFLTLREWDWDHRPNQEPWAITEAIDPGVSAYAMRGSVGGMLPWAMRALALCSAAGCLGYMVSNRPTPAVPREERRDPCLRLDERALPAPVGVDYVSSSLENSWLTESHHQQICAFAQTQSKATNLWLNYSHAIFKPNGRAPRAPSTEEAQVLSYFLDGATGEKRFIEPLQGVARSPRLCALPDDKTLADLSEALFDTRYLITENFCEGELPKSSKYYDLGAASNGGAGASWKIDYASAASFASIPLFTSLYRDRCVTFDAIYAWEAEPAAKDWWEPVPDEERAKIRFYNAPVEETVNPGNRPSWGPRGPKRIFL